MIIKKITSNAVKYYIILKIKKLEKNKPTSMKK